MRTAPTWMLLKVLLKIMDYAMLVKIYRAVTGESQTAWKYYYGECTAV
jgi:hypothetical protein